MRVSRVELKTDWYEDELEQEDCIAGFDND